MECAGTAGCCWPRALCVIRVCLGFVLWGLLAIGSNADQGVGEKSSTVVSYWSSTCSDMRARVP
eukprot:6653361-Pyramimonas_sp.AAC.1